MPVNRGADIVAATTSSIVRISATEDRIERAIV
jgi:hypothetical protein